MRPTLARCCIAAATIGAVLMSVGCSGASKPTAAAKPTTSHTSSPSAPASASATATGQPTVPPPSGYEWQGTTTQDLWVAIPKTWVALNLAKISLSQITKRFATTGIDTSEMRTDLATLKKDKALFFADLASYVTSAHGFTTNASTLCSSTQVLESGSSAIPGLEAEMRAEYATIKARVLSIKRVTIVGGLAFEATLSLTSTSGFSFRELQVVTLSNSGRACFVTFTTDNPAKFDATISTSVASIHVG